MPLVKRTRATFRSAEFGFLGVCVYTRVQTPRFCGELWSAGLAVLYLTAWRPLRTSWLIVGTDISSLFRLSLNETLSSAHKEALPASFRSLVAPHVGVPRGNPAWSGSQRRRAALFKIFLLGMF